MRRLWIVGLAPPLLAASCAATYPYKWYGLQADHYGGKLLGEKPKDDLPFSVCEPDEVEAGKCVVYLRSEHERLVAKYIELQERLKACEEGR